MLDASSDFFLKGNEGDGWQPSSHHPIPGTRGDREGQVSAEDLAVLMLGLGRLRIRPLQVGGLPPGLGLKPHTKFSCLFAAHSCSPGHRLLL